MTKDQKKIALQKYVEHIRNLINSAIPAKHSKNLNTYSAYREMLSIDLKKTLAKIETL